MLAALAMLAGNATARDALAEAEARFRTLASYRVTLRSVSGDGERQVIRYAWRRPGWVRMDFVEPHRGALMIFDPYSRRVRLWPFGPHHLPTLNLAPDNPLIRDARGHTVARSDVGALLANLAELRASGKVSPPRDAEIAGRPATLVEIEGKPGVVVAGVHRCRLWLSQDTRFPLKVQSYDAEGALIETVDMSDAELDVVFAEDFFAPA